MKNSKIGRLKGIKATLSFYHRGLGSISTVPFISYGICTVSDIVCSFAMGRMPEFDLCHLVKQLLL